MQGHPVHAKFFAIGTTGDGAVYFENVASDALERNMKLSMLSESQTSRVLISSGIILLNNLHAIISPWISRPMKTEDFEALLEVNDLKNK